MAPPVAPENKNEGTTALDWGSYSPAMLRTKKHSVLRTSKFKANLKKSDDEKNASTSLKMCQGLANAKKELALLKNQLLIKEAEQSEELRLEKEKELYNERIEGQRLKNEVLRLQIANLNKNV